MLLPPMCPSVLLSFGAGWLLPLPRLLQPSALIIISQDSFSKHPKLQADSLPTLPCCHGSQYHSSQNTVLEYVSLTH